MKRSAPATERNRGPILDVLARIVPPSGTVLEIASGTGQHAAWFAPRLPGVTWQPTDIGADALASIEAWRAETHAPGLLPARGLDVRATAWPIAQADVVFCANMIHIAPWESGLALIAGAARVLSPGGLLVLYGPFRVGGRHTAPSNDQFDQWLVAQDARWGVRDLDAVDVVAATHGFARVETVAMPANNLTVVWRKR